MPAADDDPSSFEDVDENVHKDIFLEKCCVKTKSSSGNYLLVDLPKRNTPAYNALRPFFLNEWGDVIKLTFEGTTTQYVCSNILVASTYEVVTIVKFWLFNLSGNTIISAAINYYGLYNIISSCAE